jgi:transposase-like protein
VSVPLGIVEPQQRIWGDVIRQVQAWAAQGLSLRQMQSSLGNQVKTSIGLETLNQMVQAVRTPSELALTSVPPVVMLDAIWVSLLSETGAYKKDRAGRQRSVKHKEKVCVLVALGVYPESGQWGVLGWALAEAESQAEWEPFLVRLDTRGLYRQRGLSLLIHDGGEGLEAALRQVYPHIPHQRCRFHKFQNLRGAMVVPEGLSRAERKTFKTDLLSQLRPIFDAPDVDEARRLTLAFEATY